MAATLDGADVTSGADQLRIWDASEVWRVRRMVPYPDR
jgi:hypothetical protein